MSIFKMFIEVFHVSIWDIEKANKTQKLSEDEFIIFLISKLRCSDRLDYKQEMTENVEMQT